MTQKLTKALQHAHTLIHIQTCTQSSLRQRCSDLEGELGTVRAGREKVEASLNDAQMELDNSRETLRNQTEQTEKLSKEVREGGKEKRGGGGGGEARKAPTQFISTPLSSAGGTEGRAGKKCAGESVGGRAAQSRGGRSHTEA